MTARVRQDLYWCWAKATQFRFADLGDSGLVHLLLEAAEGQTPQAFHDWLKGMNDGAGFVPEPYLRRGSRFFCALVVTSVVDVLPPDLVRRFKLGLAVRVEKNEPVGSEPVLPPGPAGSPVETTTNGGGTPAAKNSTVGKDVMPALPSVSATPRAVLAIIDDLIVKDHPDFVDPATLKSRFTLWWDQGTNESLGARKPEYGYTLRGDTRSSMAGRQILSHGTHVASIAGGNKTPAYRLRHNPRYRNAAGPMSDPAAMATLAAVCLPQATVADTSGGALAANVYDALTHLVDSAPTDASLIVNLSFGIMGGPHDGSSVLEAAMDDLIQSTAKATPPRSLEIVLPAGNSFSAQCHASLDIDGSAGTPTVYDLIWRVLPDDQTPSFMEIWLPNGTVAEIDVVDPSGTVSARSSSNDNVTWPKNARGPDVQGGIFHSVDPANGDDGQLFLIALSPTRCSDPMARAPVVPHGDWTIKISNKGKQRLPIRAWIERDNASFGQRRRGRQSYFPEQDELRQRSALRPSTRTTGITGFGTLNGVACGKRTKVIGGYRLSDDKLSPYTGAGTKDGAVRPPDWTGPSDESAILVGIPGASVTRLATVRMSGTSVASPLAARAFFNQLIAPPAGQAPATAPSGPAPRPVDPSNQAQNGRQGRLRLPK